MDNNIYKCDYCGIKFKPKSNYRQYRIQKHYFCSNLCSTMFRFPKVFTKIYSSTEKPYYWGYFLGVFCSDGSIYIKRKVISLSVIEKTFMDLFLKAIKEITGNNYIAKQYKNRNRKKKIWKVNFVNHSLYNELLKIGNFGKYIWKVPDMVLNGSREIKRGFLNGFFDGDGYVTKAIYPTVLTF